MRAGLLYSLFVIFILLIVSSELKEKKQTFGEVTSCQLADANKWNDCLLTAINYSLKEPIWEFVTFGFTNEKLLQNAYDQKIKFSINLRFRQFKSIDFQAIKQYFQIPLHYTLEKEDSHLLS